MTNEQKQLLIIDLCARLPYGVIIEGLSGPVKLSDYYSRIDITKARLYKPYLRPLSSMTDEEKEELGNCENSVQRTDFFYSHHIDCRFMIEKGLALEAPEGMYKID